jgi:hypothetical protein
MTKTERIHPIGEMLASKRTLHCLNADSPERV